jgi:signal transduction histidine kinase/CheY-like chemotaxis protein/HAMP domain-containing protein
MNLFKQWLDRSLGRRIGVLVSVLLLLVCGAITAVSYLQVLNLAREATETRLRLVGRQLADLLARGPLGAVSTLGKVVSDPSFSTLLIRGGHPDTAAVDRLLRQRMAPTSRIAFDIRDGTGTTVRRIGPAGQPAWFGPAEVAIPEGSTVGPFVRLEDSTIYYDIRVPIPGSLPGSVVERTRVNISNDGAAAINTLVGPGTQILIGSPVTGAWTDLARVVGGPPAGASRIDTASVFVLEGDSRIGIAQETSGVPWVVMVSMSQAVVDAPAYAYLRRAIMVALLAMVLGTIGAAALGHRLSGPIREITDVTERLASGDIETRANEKSSGEIGRLARSFNAMLEQVTHSTARLRDSEVSLRAFVSHASQGIWHAEFSPSLETDVPTDYQIDQWYLRSPMVECNPALARMLGVEFTGDLIDVPLEQLFPRADPPSQALLREFIAQGYLISHAELQTAGGEESKRVFVNDLIGLVEHQRLRRIWGTRREVTMERMLDDRLAQAQRLEAIGRLAGGVSHDFNNLLTVILAHSDLLLERLGDGSADRGDVEEIRQTAMRAAQLTRQLLLFSRGQVARPGVVNVNQVTSSVEGMLRRVIGEDIALTLRLTPDVSLVRADQGQLEQVLMNLVVNARDAMPEGGSLELRTGEVEIDAEYVRLRPTMRPGRYVMIAVTDTGVGMPIEVQQHAFEPFFTTKAKGSGTGLGLATVYGIARQGGGDVTIYSEVGRGTTVKVFLPARSEGVLPSTDGFHAAPVNLAGNETILLIEDEPSLRDMVRRALTATGYTVIAAADGAEGIRLSEQRSEPVDLVLTDMILPGMSGRELSAEFRRRLPGLPIIIMSGYTGETYPALEALPEGVGYLEKPFSLADLRNRVRESLDEAPR